MVDITEAPIVASAAPAAPVADTAVIAPVAEAPVVVAEVSAPAAVETPVVEAAIESKPVTETPSTVESVLGDAKPTEVNTETPVAEKKDAPKVDGDKPADVKTETVTETKVELPVYEAFKVPENVTLDKEPLDAFTKILGEIETGKLDHAGMQSKGQALIDLATKATTDSITRLNDYYVQFHENQKKEWFNSFKSDPDMGGDKLDATVGALRDAVETYAGNEKQVAEFRQLMKDTGVGNHPAVTRLIYNMQQKINKYTTEGDGQRMVPGAKPAPSKVKDFQRFYGGN